MFVRQLKESSMGGETRKEVPVIIDGESSFVLVQTPESDAAQGWSVTARPYRSRAESDLLDNMSSEATCLLAGNRVLLADGSQCPIERVCIGDHVMTMSGAAPVRSVETTTLGMTRRVIELRGVGDECLMLSDDHPLWAARRNAQGATVESWGTYNLNHVLFEMRNMLGYDLKSVPIPLNFDLPEQIAHVNGWLHVRPIYHHMDPATPLHHLVVDGGFSFIAEGFAVFSHCADSQGPTTAWTGLRRVCAADRFVDALGFAA
jgi:hypothetical protein